MNIDLTILNALNSLVASKGFWFRLLDAAGNNPLFRGAPVLAALVLVSFSQPSTRGRSKILLGFLGTSLALVVSVWCQSHLHVHLRPIFDDSLHIKDVEGWAISKNTWGERLYSLPSDTATAYFAIGTIIFLQRKVLGLFCCLWIVLTIGIGRVALGIHYPSDIFAGFLLGSTFAYFFTNLKMAQASLSRLMERYDARNYIYMIFVFLFSAEAYSLFPGLQGMYFSLKQLLDH